jgi:hypothetical protein
MPAATQNLIVDQGTTFRYQATWKGLSAQAGNTYQPFDITNGYLLMEIRRAPGSTPIISLSQAQPGYQNASSLLILEEPGTFEIYITSVDTDTFTFNRAKYDILFMHPDGEVSPVMRGNIIVNHRITNVQELISRMSSEGA